jgi:hypothetical protein
MKIVKQLIGYMVAITSVNYVVMSGELMWLFITLAGILLIQDNKLNEGKNHHS